MAVTFGQSPPFDEGYIAKSRGLLAAVSAKVLAVAECRNAGRNWRERVRLGCQCRNEYLHAGLSRESVANSLSVAHGAARHRLHLRRTGIRLATTFADKRHQVSGRVIQ